MTSNEAKKTGQTQPTDVGDMAPETFRAAMHRVADMVADYLEQVGDLPVRPKVKPGETKTLFPDHAPEIGESADAILDDFTSLVLPNTAHWNHPGFMAYFTATAARPGILGETLASAMNLNAMLWRTSPVATELEELVCDWLRKAMGLPECFVGHLNDTASIGSLVALAAARHCVNGRDIRRKGMSGRADLPTLTVYASEEAHSSIGKACVTLGFGLDNLRKIPVDDNYRMKPEALAEAIQRDRAAGCLPVAVVATVGTTSTTAIDPVPEIATICQREKIWLHVDAAYAGTGAIVPEIREMMPGLEHADSLVTNPHKWLFVPVDCSALYVRNPEALREAFSIVPHYLTTPEGAATNLMDYGVQLGRRFRALKFWMVVRSFGLEGLRQRMRYQRGLAQKLASWIGADERFEVCAPVNLTTVCFRATPDLPLAEQDQFNQDLLAKINANGKTFISHTRLKDHFVMRACVGNLRTDDDYLASVWKVVQDCYPE